MRKIVRLWMLLVLALTLGLAISVTASADAPAIGGKSQWKVGDTITFDSHTYYFNKVNADDSSNSEMNPGTYTIATEGWIESDKWFNYMFKKSGAYYLHIRPVDYQSAEHPTPAGIWLVSGEGTQASPYKFDLWYTNVVTKEKSERVSTVYAGEIFVDGESKMTWLYSTDLSNSEIVFQRLRECLSQTAFDGLVPAMTGETAAKGLAVSSDHQSEMGSGWKSAATVAGQYFTGTVGSEKSGNFYDENAVYKTAVDAHYAERKETYDTPLGFNKTIGSTLSTSTDFVWENHDGVLTKKYTVTAKVEETTVIYTTVNVTSEKETQPTTQQTETSAPTVAEDLITIPKTPAKIKTKAKKNRITVSWNKIKKNKKTKALRAKIKGIEVQYSTDRSFPKETTITKTVRKNKTKYMIKGLKRKTMYYVRVRYTDRSGGYSRWSKVKRARTK